MSAELRTAATPLRMTNCSAIGWWRVQLAAKEKVLRGKPRSTDLFSVELRFYAPAPAARTIGCGLKLAVIWLKYMRYER